MTRYAAKTDANQSEIIAAIEKAGYYVHDCSRYGGGFPDLLCVNKYGQVVLLEVKTPGGTLTPAEMRFKGEYPGAYYIVRSAEAALDYLGMRWEE